MSDIACDIMNTKKIQKVRHQIARYRRLGGVRGRMLERLAIQLGRKRHKRGKEPIWVSDILPSARPLSIPSHPGDLNRFTARTILDVLESDLEAIERLAEEGDPNA
jgi:hypothetical protein